MNLIKRLIIAFTLLLGIAKIGYADEGMWLLNLVDRLNGVDLKKMGCQLTPEEIYSINTSSIKDALVGLSRGTGSYFCSGSIISNEGLLLTNHHCAINFIQAQSTVEKDYLQNGFWAASRNEELKNDKLSASFLVRIEDVSQKVLSLLSETMTEPEREAKILETCAKIEADAIKGTLYNAKVSSFFEGNEFYLFIYETYNDVRLVGTPPTSLGTFGNITDNWQWPRHVADFSLFRVYMSAKGEPADYSKKNIAYKPKKFLPISLKGYQKDDFAMLFGYPGTTDRMITSYGINVVLDQVNPTIVKIRDEKLKIIKAYMAESEDAKIKYTSKFFTSDNYFKYFTGQIEVCKRLKVYEKKKEIEESFTSWINTDPKLKEKYGSALNTIQSAYEDIKKYNLGKYYFVEGIERGSELIAYAKTFDDLYAELKKDTPDQEKITTITTTLKYAATKFFRDFDLNTDKKIFTALTKLFYTDVPKDQLPDVFTNFDKKYKGNFQLFANDIYDKSLFSSKEKILDFLTEPKRKVLDTDPLYKAMVSFYAKITQITEILKEPNLKLKKGNRLFVAGLREMSVEKKFYPNANSTLRLSYGKISDYTPPSGKEYKYFTTLDEMIQKENPKNPEFVIPQRLKELYNNKDYGRYGSNGTMVLDFISNNDQTGGNSGSPVLNGKGELIGVAFDINWEATSSSLAFDPLLQRSITLDARFMLFIIDKYAGATNLLKEMTIIEN